MSERYIPRKLREEVSYKRGIDKTSQGLRDVRVNPRRVQETLETTFGHTVDMEPQVSQLMETSLALVMVQLAQRGVSLAESAQTVLSDKKAARLAHTGKKIHTRRGGPPLPTEYMAGFFKDIGFPLAGIGNALTLIAAIGDEEGRFTLPHERSVVRGLENLPRPEDTLPAAQAFLDADPENGKIAEKMLTIARDELLQRRKERDIYTRNLAKPGVQKGKGRKEALIGVRQGFGESNMQAVETALLKSLPRTGATEAQAKRLADAMIAYAV